MFSRIMRMLMRRTPEFVIIFMFQTAMYFMLPWLFYVNAICVTILCILYIPLIIFVVPTLPTWYRSKIGDIPKLNVVQLVLCAIYAASAWAPMLWEFG